MTDTPRIDPTLATAAVAAPPPAANAAETTPRVHQQLQRLPRLAAEQPAADEVTDPEDLQKALRTADDGSIAAMDLRRQLEAAFEKHLR